MSSRKGDSYTYPLKKGGRVTGFRQRGGSYEEQPEKRKITKTVPASYRSTLARLSRGTLKDVSDSDKKSLRLLVMKFKYDLAHTAVVPGDEKHPESVLLILDAGADNRTRGNLKKAVEWRSWETKPRMYLVHRKSRSAFAFDSKNAPATKDLGGVLLQWGNSKKKTGG